MAKFVELEPRIYRVIKGDKNFNLKIENDRYEIKKKLYGNVHKLIYRINRLIQLKMYNSISVIASGKAGMGKTTSLNALCNLMLDSKIPIIEIKFIDITTELIEFLSNFRKVVIYIDEFGKLFGPNEQDKALTLLNKHNGNENIFLLGENDLYKISRFILDRMERVKYHLTHDRITKDVMKEYCMDNGLNNHMLHSLNKINEKTSVISYDTLEILAEEHKIFPELSFEELTEIMNCQSIIGIPVIDIRDITLESDVYYLKSYDLTDWCRKVKESDFIDGKASVQILLNIQKIEEPVVSDTPEQQNKFNIFNPMSGASTQGSGVTIATKSNNIIRIDDLDNTIYLETSIPYNGVNIKANIIYGTKLIPVTTY